jgi:hypothetical protein
MNQKASLSTGSSTRSFQVADSGVEEVLYQIHKNASAHDNLNSLASAVGGSCISPGVIEFPVAGGEAKVVFYQDETTVYNVACGTDDDWRDKVVKIKSEGTAGSTTRAVEVAVAASSELVAFVGFDGTNCPGGICDIRAKKNISRVEYLGAGDYQVFFATPMSNSNYAVTGGAGSTGANGLVWHHVYEQDANYVKTAVRCWPNTACDQPHIAIAVYK